MQKEKKDIRKKLTLRLSEKDYLLLKEKIDRSGLSMQNYLYFSALSKPILVKDYYYLNEISNQISDIEKHIKENISTNMKNKDDMNFLKDEYKQLIKELEKIWLMLKEFL